MPAKKEEKLISLRDDLVARIKREDAQVLALAELLHKRKLITDQDLKSLVTMEPFAQLV